MLKFEMETFVVCYGTSSNQPNISEFKANFWILCESRADFSLADNQVNLHVKRWNVLQNARVDGSIHDIVAFWQPSDAVKWQCKASIIGWVVGILMNPKFITRIVQTKMPVEFEIFWEKNEAKRQTNKFYAGQENKIHESICSACPVLQLGIHPHTSSKEHFSVESFW